MANKLDNKLQVEVRVQSDKPAAGASVSVDPGSQKTTTDNNGLAIVTLTSDKLHKVTIVYDGKSETVPFYTTENGSRILRVDLNHLKATSTSNHNVAAGSKFFLFGAVITTVMVAMVITVYFLLRKGRPSKV